MDQVSQEIVPKKNTEKIIEEALQNRLKTSAKPFVPLLSSIETGSINL